MPFLVFTSMSMDGFIGDREKNPPWNHGFHPDAFGYKRLMETVNLIVMGRTTFEQVRNFPSWPWETQDVLVVTSRPLYGELPDRVSAWNDGVANLVTILGSRRESEGIWIMGGPRLIQSFLHHDALDTLHLCLLPLLLGDGSKLIDPISSAKMLRLVDQTTNDDGSLKLVYSL